MKKQKWNIIFIIVASLIVLGIIFFNFDFDQLYHIMVSSNKLWLTLAFVSMAAYCIAECCVLYFTANCKERKLRFGTALKTTMVGLLFNNLTPFASGGQPMQLYYLTKASFQVGEASSILLMKFIVYQGALIVYSTILLIVKFGFFYKEAGNFALLIGVGFIINVAVVIGLILIGLVPGFTEKITTAIIKLLAKIHIVKHKETTIENAKNQIAAFHSGFKELMTQKHVLIKSTLITALQLTCMFLIPFFICLALKVTVTSALSIIAASAFVMMVSAFIPLPGASGGAEGSFYLLFGIFITNKNLIAVAIVLWRLITFYLPIIIGVFFCRVKQEPETIEAT